MILMEKRACAVKLLNKKAQLAQVLSDYRELLVLARLVHSLLRFLSAIYTTSASIFQHSPHQTKINSLAKIHYPSYKVEQNTIDAAGKAVYLQQSIAQVITHAK